MKPFRHTSQFLAWQTFRKSVLLGLASTLALGGQVAVAQTSEAQTSESIQLEEILVTATRRVTDVQLTPVAVTAIDSEKFESLFAADIGEVSLLTPNFSAAKITGFNAAGFAIRGASQTDILVYWEPPVGVIVDNFVVPHMQTQLLDPYDIESVEVLRGPQGTLFGKNTTAGVVHVKTKKPIFNEWGFDASLSGGAYGRRELKGSVNIPVIDNTLAFRIAGFIQKSDGYYENGKVSLGSAGGDYVGDGASIGGDDSESGRIKMLWSPTDNLSFHLQYEYLRDNGDSPPAVNETDPASSQLFNTLFLLPGVTSGDPLKQAGVTNRDFLADGTTSTGLGFSRGHEIKVDGYYMNIDWDIGNFVLTSTTGYREQDSNLPSTYTGEVGNESGVVSIFDANRYDERETFQQELRLTSHFDGSFNFVTGIFYQEDETSFNVAQYLGLLEIFGSAIDGVLDDDNPLLISNKQDSDSTAIYFDGTYDFGETWSFSAGIRYTDENKNFFSRPATPIVVYGEGPGSLPFDGNDVGNYPCDTTNPLDCRTDKGSWDEVTYRLLVANQFSDKLYGYVGFSHGFKSGGYSDQAGSGLDVPLSAIRYDPEKADSFEIGLKAEFWDGRARINTALFYVKYTDQQRATIVTIGALQETVVFNAAEVDAYGLEVEATVLLTDGLILQANLGWLDSEYQNFDLDLDLDPSTPPASLDGNDVARAPKIQAGIDLTYTYTAGWGDLRLIAGVYYEGESTNYYAIDGGTPVPEFNTTLQERTLVNASITYTHPSNTWYVAAFGKNLTDERYRNASQYVGGLWTFSTYAEPRVWGVEVGARFGSSK